VFGADFVGGSWKASQQKNAREASWLKVSKLAFAQESKLGREAFLQELSEYLREFRSVVTAEFQIVSIQAKPAAAGGMVSLAVKVRFELVGEGDGFYREQRVGNWEQTWERAGSGQSRLQSWRVVDEERSRASVQAFQDISAHVFGGNASFGAQFVPGTDYWRTVLDSATGIDIYGHNGVAVGDFDGDGLDDLYISRRVCQIDCFGIEAMERSRMSRTQRAWAFWRIRRARCLRMYAIAVDKI
jgi:hypothetical protein